MVFRLPSNRDSNFAPINTQSVSKMSIEKSAIVEISASNYSANKYLSNLQNNEISKVELDGFVDLRKCSNVKIYLQKDRC